MMKLKLFVSKIKIPITSCFKIIWISFMTVYVPIFSGSDISGF